MGYLWPIYNRELWTHTSIGHGLSFVQGGAMGCRIDPSWGGRIELFLGPASASRLV